MEGEGNRKPLKERKGTQVKAALVLKPPGFESPRTSTKENSTRRPLSPRLRGFFSPHFEGLHSGPRVSLHRPTLLTLEWREAGDGEAGRAPQHRSLP